MAKYFYFRLALFLGSALLPAFSYASLIVTPTKVEIGKGESIKELTLRNHTGETKNFQLTIFRVRNESGQPGEEIYEKSGDLVAIPRIFKMSPNSVQVIRVGIKNRMYRVGKRVYAVSIKELPRKKKKGESSNVQFATELVVPISIAPRSPDEPAASPKLSL